MFRMGYINRLFHLSFSYFINLTKCFDEVDKRAVTR